MSNPQVAELCNFAHTADKEARSDLAGGFIRDEDDYTSNFTGALRRIINSNSTTGLSATSFLLGTSVERSMGCDAAVIVRSNGQVKIATFEAKLPRFTDPYHRWDYAQTSSGLSHFSDQLERQKRFAGTLAVFEMFYCEAPFNKQPPHMQSEASSCVWHSDAIRFDSCRSASRPPWTQNELSTMLKAGNCGIDSILRAVCECRSGEPISMPEDPTLVAREFGLSGHVLFVNTSGNQAIDLSGDGM